MSRHDKVWTTSVSELVGVFRAAMAGLMPWLQKARIPVGIHVGTDGWDEISEVLFRHFVVEAIRWSRPEAEIDRFKLPAYETSYETYSEFSGVIEVVAPELSPRQAARHFVFHSLKASPGAAALDVVVACPVDEALAQSGELIDVLYSRCEFRCLVPQPDGEPQVLHSIEVGL